MSGWVGDEDEDKLWSERTVLSEEMERIRWRDGEIDGKIII